MSHHDLRSFLYRLERDRQLLRVQVPVDPHLESTALSLRALREAYMPYREELQATR